MKRFLVAVGILAVPVALAHAAMGPETRCEAGKNHESGKYAFCLQRAEARLLRTRGICSATPGQTCYRDENCPTGEFCQKDTTTYVTTVTKCEETYAAKWDRLEQRTVENDGVCPDGLLPEQVKEAIDEYASNIAAGLAGNGLQNCSGDLATCTMELDHCSNTELPGCLSTRDQCVNADLPSCNASLGACSTSLSICNTDLGTCSSDYALCASDLGTCNANLASAEACGNGAIDAGEECDLANLNGGTCALEGFGGGPLICNSNCTYDTTGCYAQRFVDNGDGTISDQETGLMWEKKAGYDGLNVTCTSPAVCPDPHDADNSYFWSTNPPTPNGSVYWLFLARLNGRCDGDNSTVCATDAQCAGIGNGLCGHAGFNDWRLPTHEELRSVVDFEDGTSPATFAAFDTACDSSCTVATCSCTALNVYWSASTSLESYNSAWGVGFWDGSDAALGKNGDAAIRAVRTARFIDNGDGTVSDTKTGLMWEKKADYDGPPGTSCTNAATCPDPHDADNRYSWSSILPNSDGTVYTVFLQQLNTTCDGDNSTPCTIDSQCAGVGNGLCGHGGHTDWRLPAREELRDLLSDAATEAPVVHPAFNVSCSASCSVTNCSCTTTDGGGFWSSSTSAQLPTAAWVMEFGQGSIGPATKSAHLPARAVRTAL